MLQTIFGIFSHRSAVRESSGTKLLVGSETNKAGMWDARLGQYINCRIGEHMPVVRTCNKMPPIQPFLTPIVWPRRTVFDRKPPAPMSAALPRLLGKLLSN